MILDYAAIGRRIRAAREKCGMTQEALAAKSDLSVPHISHIETASTKLALPSIISIANALSVSVDKLLCDNVLHSKVVFEKEAMEIFEDCSDFEIRILVDLLKASKSTLRSSEQFQKNLRYLKKS